VQDFDGVAVQDAGHTAGDYAGQSEPCEIEREREECNEATAHRPHGSSSSSLAKGRTYLVPSPTRPLPIFAASEERIVLDEPS
jgi:hypothetical protein